MHPGDLRSFYRLRLAWWAVLLVSALLLVAGGWWLVERVLLAPAAPDGASPAEAVVSFLADPRGLPALPPERGERFVASQIERLLADAGFREAFLSACRSASPEEQRALRTHLFDVFKRSLLRDVEVFRGTPPDRRTAWLDARIVEYARRAALHGDVRIEREALGGAAGTKEELAELMLTRTSEAERIALAGYLSAYAERIGAILSDEGLRAEFEERIRRGGGP